MFKEMQTRTNNIIQELKKVAMQQESLNDIDVRIKVNFERLVMKTEKIIIDDVHERFAVKKNGNSKGGDKKGDEEAKKKN